MGLVSALLKPFRSVGLFAAAGERAPADVKVPKSQQARPSWMTKTNVASGRPLTPPDRRLINTDITKYRGGKDTPTIVRDFATVTPDLSASVDAYIRMALTANYTATAFNTDGTPNAEASAALQTLLTRLDTLKDYSEGFSNISSIRALSETLVKEARYYDAMAVELVLDKSRMPVRIQPVPVSTVRFSVSKDGLQPVQKVDNEEISLDYPTFFYRAIDADLLTPYPVSPLEAALQPVLFMQEMQNDLRRIVRQAIHPRLRVKLDTKNILAMMPPEYRETSEKTQEYFEMVVDSIAERINGLQPEDALVALDTMDVEYMTAGNISHDTEMTALVNIISDKVSAGAKTLPSILGHGSSSSNIASTEAQLFLKSADGVQFALNDLLSQALTLAVRLLGYDVTVRFAYDRIDLRPDSELEAFKAMRQSRVLELLSLGSLTDEEASLMLTGRLPLAGAPKLSGTGFRANTAADIPNNPYSGTSQGTLNQNLNSDAPKNAKSQNGGQKGNR